MEKNSYIKLNIRFNAKPSHNSLYKISELHTVDSRHSDSSTIPKFSQRQSLNNKKIILILIKIYYLHFFLINLLNFLRQHFTGDFIENKISF